MTVPAANIGASMIIGGQTSISGYIVRDEEVNGVEPHNEIKVDNADGTLAAIITPALYPTVSLTLLCKTGAAPATDFPEKKLATSGAGSYSGWYVNGAKIKKTFGVQEVTVNLISYGLT
jgi:hypothetical protein